jgi:hypothetical protein
LEKLKTNPPNHTHTTCLSFLCSQQMGVDEQGDPKEILTITFNNRTGMEIEAFQPILVEGRTKDDAPVPTPIVVDRGDRGWELTGDANVCPSLLSSFSLLLPYNPSIHISQVTPSASPRPTLTAPSIAPSTAPSTPLILPSSHPFLFRYSSPPYSHIRRHSLVWWEQQVSTREATPSTSTSHSPAWQTSTPPPTAPSTTPALH